MNNKEIIFVDGMFFKPVSDITKEKAPWVKGHLSIKREEFLKFLQGRNTEYINIDMKVSKNTNKIYLQVNEWKKETPLSEEDKNFIKSVRQTNNAQVAKEVETPF